MTKLFLSTQAIDSALQYNDWSVWTSCIVPGVNYQHIAEQKNAAKDE